MNDFAAATSMIGSDFKTAEGLFKKQYELIRHSEEKLPKGKRQTLETLINEEALLFAKYLRNEMQDWHPRLPQI